MSVDPLPECVQQHQGYNTANKIGEPCSKFIDAKNFHRGNLQPEKKRGLLRRRLEVDLYIHVIPGKDHLPRRLGIIHLIGVEEVDRSKVGQHEK